MALEDTHTAGLCLEGTSWFFTMPTATSNRHCQIQGTLVASLEDGRFWICTHVQNFKGILKKKKNESTKITSSSWKHGQTKH